MCEILGNFTMSINNKPSANRQEASGTVRIRQIPVAERAGYSESLGSPELGTRRKG